MKTWKNTLKRGLSGLIAIAMCLSMAQLSVFAADDLPEAESSAAAAADTLEEAETNATDEEEESSAEEPEESEESAEGEELDGEEPGDLQSSESSEESEEPAEGEEPDDLQSSESPAESEEPAEGSEPAGSGQPDGAIGSEVPGEEELSEVAEAFLAAVAALPEEMTAENLEETKALITAAEEAWAALEEADQALEQVAAAKEELDSAKAQASALEAPEIPEALQQLRALLDEMEAFELTEENQEEYQALGMQALELLEAVMEDEALCAFEGVEEDMARFQALADKQTGGAEVLALISGEQFTVKVVKVVNGNEVDSVTLTPKCLQSTGHSGYNHSTNLRTLANQSGFSGYKGYNWSKSSTVPSTYTSGLTPNNNYAPVHYNITGSAPYKADETLFLFFETSKTFTLKYDANGGSGAPAQQTQSSTASSVKFTISTTKPKYQGHVFKGWSTSSSGPVSYQPGGSIAVTGTTTLYAIWDPENPKLSVTKETVGAAEVRPGDTVNFKITVKNEGNVALPTVTIADVLPAGLKFVSSIPQPDAASGQVLIWVSGLDVGETETYAVTAQVEDAATGTLTNQAKAQSSIPAARGEDTADVTVKADDGAGIKLKKDRTSAKGESRNPAEVGDTVTWDITVTNESKTSARTVTLTESLADTTLSYGGQSAVGSLTVTVAAGTSITVQASHRLTQVDYETAKKHPLTRLYNTIQGETAEKDPETGEPFDTSAIDDGTKMGEPELKVEKQVTPQTDVKVGDTLHYTITVTNSGKVAAKGVVITDNLDLSKLDVQQVQLNGSAASLTAGRISAGDLAPGASATLEITAKVKAAGEIKNTASAKPENGRPQPSNEVVVTAEKEPDPIEVEKSVSPESAPAGEKVTYTVSIRNESENAKTVAFMDLMPAELELVEGSVKLNGAAVTGMPKDIEIAGKGTATVTYQAKIAEGTAAGTQLVNTATATLDGESSQDSATVTVTEKNPGPEDSSTGDSSGSGSSGESSSSGSGSSSESSSSGSGSSSESSSSGSGSSSESSGSGSDSSSSESSGSGSDSSSSESSTPGSDSSSSESSSTGSDSSSSESSTPGSDSSSSESSGTGSDSSSSESSTPGSDSSSSESSSSGSDSSSSESSTPGSDSSSSESSGSGSDSSSSESSTPGSDSSSSESGTPGSGDNPTAPVTPVTPSDDDDDDDDDDYDSPDEEDTDLPRPWMGTNPNDPTVNIPDEPTPLANVPDAQVPLAADPNLIDIFDEDTPLASTPFTGDSSHTALWAALCGLSLFGAAVLLGRKKRGDEE